MKPHNHICKILVCSITTCDIELIILIMSKYFHTQVKELGKPTMSLFEPDVTTKKATFGMS